MIYKKLVDEVKLSVGHEEMRFVAEATERYNELIYIKM